VDYRSQLLPFCHACIFGRTTLEQLLHPRAGRQSANGATSNSTSRLAPVHSPRSGFRICSVSANRAQPRRCLDGTYPRWPSGPHAVWTGDPAIADALDGPRTTGRPEVRSSTPAGGKGGDRAQRSRTRQTRNYSHATTTAACSVSAVHHRCWGRTVCRRRLTCSQPGRERNP
jgi:hypothetical protein